MPYLTAAVVLVGLLGAANTVLTLGVIRRLREHEALLRGGGLPSAGLPPAGGAVPPFAAVSTAGERITSADLPLPAVISFFDVECEPCQKKVPHFLAEAAALPELNVLSVVVGEAGSMSAALEPAGPVVVEAADSGLSRAFGVRGFPVMCLLDGTGRVARWDSDLSALVPDPAGEKAARR